MGASAWSFVMVSGCHELGQDFVIYIYIYIYTVYIYIYIYRLPITRLPVRQ